MSDGALHGLGFLMDQEIAAGPSPLLGRWLGKLKASHSRMKAKVEKMEVLIDKVTEINSPPDPDSSPAVLAAMERDRQAQEHPVILSPFVFGREEYSDALYTRSIRNSPIEAQRTGRIFSSPAEKCPIRKPVSAKELFQEVNYPWDCPGRVDEYWERLSDTEMESYFEQERLDTLRYDQETTITRDKS